MAGTGYEVHDRFVLVRVQDTKHQTDYTLFKHIFCILRLLTHILYFISPNPRYIPSGDLIGRVDLLG